MELRALRYFVEVVRQQSFTVAAEQMFVTQPTISKMVKSLEDEIWRTAQPTPELIEQWREEIEEIDAYAGQIRMPQRYFQDVYALKQAIAVVRNRIVQIAAHTSHANIPD